jgi:Glycosyl transferases group 1
VLKLLDKADVLVMTSDFEGLLVILLEAMSHGCVPVVTKTESGMDELIKHHENGFLLPVGDVERFVDVLAKLSLDPALLSRLRRAAFERIRSGGFTLQRAASDYRSLFESLMHNDAEWRAPRTGKAVIPAHYRMRQRILLRLKTACGGPLFGPPQQNLWVTFDVLWGKVSSFQWFFEF